MNTQASDELIAEVGDDSAAYTTIDPDLDEIIADATMDEPTEDDE